MPTYTDEYLEQLEKAKAAALKQGLDPVQYEKDFNAFSSFQQPTTMNDPAQRLNFMTGFQNTGSYKLDIQGAAARAYAAGAVPNIDEFYKMAAPQVNLSPEENAARIAQFEQYGLTPELAQAWTASWNKPYVPPESATAAVTPNVVLPPTPTSGKIDSFDEATADSIRNIAIARGVDPDSNWIWNLSGEEAYKKKLDEINKAIEAKLKEISSVSVGDSKGYQPGNLAPVGMPDELAASLGLIPRSEAAEYTSELASVAPPGFRYMGNGYWKAPDGTQYTLNEMANDPVYGNYVRAGLGIQLKTEDGWTVNGDGSFTDSTGAKFSFEELLQEFYRPQEQIPRGPLTEDSQLEAMVSQRYQELTNLFTALFPTDKMDAILDRYEADPDAFQREMIAIGMNTTTERLVRFMFPSASDAEVYAFFGKAYIPSYEEWLKMPRQEEGTRIQFGPIDTRIRFPWEKPDLSIEAYNKWKSAVENVPVAIKAVTAGLGDVANMIAGAAAWLGQDGIASYINEDVPLYQRLGLGLDDDPTKLSWQDIYVGAFRSSPFMLATIGPGFLVGLGSKALGATIGLGKFGQIAFAGLGGGGVSAAIEASLEAGAVYDQSLQAGLTPEQANQAADQVFKGNLALLGISNVAQLAVFFMPGGSFLRASKYLKFATVGGEIVFQGFTEGFEEYAQDRISREAMGQKVEWDDDAKATVIIGALMGAGMGGGSVAWNYFQDKVVTNLPPAIRAEVDEKVAEATAQGTDPATATTEALDAVAEENPEVIKDVVALVVEEAQTDTEAQILGVESPIVEQVTESVNQETQSAVKEPWQMTRYEWGKQGEAQAFSEDSEYWKSVNELNKYIDTIITGKKYSRGGIIADSKYTLELNSRYFNPSDFTIEQKNKIAELKDKVASVIKKYHIDTHKELVKQALTEGKPVPAEVLADYPDLAPITSKPVTPQSIANKQIVNKKRINQEAKKEAIAKKYAPKEGEAPSYQQIPKSLGAAGAEFNVPKTGKELKTLKLQLVEYINKNVPADKRGKFLEDIAKVETTDQFWNITDKANKLVGMWNDQKYQTWLKKNGWHDFHFTVTEKVAPDAPLDKLVKLLKGAIPATEEQKIEYAAERGKRFTMTRQVLETNKGREAYYKQLAMLKGELPHIDLVLDAAGVNMTGEDIDALLTKIQEFPEFMQGQQIAAETALMRLLDGKLPTESGIELLGKVFGPELSDLLLRMRSFKQVLIEEILSALNLPRALMASFDNSFALRQAATLFWGNPKEAAGAVKASFQAMFSEDTSHYIQQKIVTNPMFQRLSVAGVYQSPWGKMAGNLSQREEAFMTKFAHHIPWVKMSERAYVIGLNKIRADIFYSYAKNNPNASVRQDRQVAQAINILSGRGELGEIGNKAAPVLNTMLFSPRLIASRLEAPTLLLSQNPIVRKMAAKGIASWFAMNSIFLMLIVWAGGQVELDPRSSDFGKGRLGDTRLDFWGGFQQYARLLAQLISEQRKTTTTGEITEIDRLEASWNFARGKLSPAFSMFADLLSGKTSLGEEVTVQNQVIDRLTPLFIRDLYDAFKANGLLGFAQMIPGFFGVGVNTYGIAWPDYVNKLGTEVDGKVYTTKNLYGDAAIYFSGADPNYFSKFTPPAVNSAYQASLAKKEASVYPKSPLYRLADPADAYDQYLEVQRINADPDELEAFKKAHDGKSPEQVYTQWDDGQMTQAQFVLLQQYNKLTTQAQKDAFLKQHPDLAANRYEDYLVANVEQNALLALWGQAPAMTQEAHDKAMEMATELGIPESALTHLPPKDIAPAYFAYQNAPASQLDDIRKANPAFDAWGNEYLGWTSFKTPQAKAIYEEKYASKE